MAGSTKNSNSISSTNPSSYSTSASNINVASNGGTGSDAASSNKFKTFGKNVFWEEEETYDNDGDEPQIVSKNQKKGISAHFLPSSMQQFQFASFSPSIF